MADTIELWRCDGHKFWGFFSRHHYLSDSYNGHGAFVAIMENKLVGFTSYISYPNWQIPQPVRRAHRTVVIPDYQGMGIGVRLSDAMGEIMLREGFRFYSKTSHPRMGEYRNNSPFWRPTVKNGVAREGRRPQSRWQAKRVASYSHEFIGSDPNLYQRVLENTYTLNTSQMRLFNDEPADTEQ